MLDARNFKAKKIIDGVTVVHTGRYLYVHKEKQEILEMYDSNGNRFYSNCVSLEKAEKLVEKLKQEGKNAVIGPKAPWKGKAGQPIKNQSENNVDVYIVKEKEEQSKETVPEKLKFIVKRVKNNHFFYKNI